MRLEKSSKFINKKYKFCLPWRLTKVGHRIWCYLFKYCLSILGRSKEGKEWSSVEAKWTIIEMATIIRGLESPFFPLICIWIDGISNLTQFIALLSWSQLSYPKSHYFSFVNCLTLYAHDSSLCWILPLFWWHKTIPAPALIYFLLKYNQQIISY